MAESTVVARVGRLESSMYRLMQDVGAAREDASIALGSNREIRERLDTMEANQIAQLQMLKVLLEHFGLSEKDQE